MDHLHPLSRDWISLHRHRPFGTCPVEALSARIGPPRGDCIALGFRTEGDLARVRWPAGPPRGDGPWRRGDALWRTTCFEMFVARQGEGRYREVNLTPSGHWAGYALDGYRQGMRTAHDMKMLGGKWRIGERRAELQVVIGLPRGYREQPLRIGISAVIEDLDGTISHWALVHPHGRPDFHDPACFALRLPAAAKA